MNKELEAFNRIKTAPSFMGGTPEYRASTQSETPYMQDCALVESALLKAQENEKVLSIIKEKRVIVNLLIDNNLEDYNNKIIIIYGYALSTGRLLTKEEFDLLIRYLKEDKSE